MADLATLLTIMASGSAQNNLRLLHHLDLAGIIYLDVRPFLLADHHAMNSDGLALEMGSRVVNARLGEFGQSTLGDDHAQIFRVTVALPRSPGRLGLEPVQHFVLWTSISTVTDSLTRLMASTADRFIAHSSMTAGRCFGFFAVILRICFLEASRLVRRYSFEMTTLAAVDEEQTTRTGM